MAVAHLVPEHSPLGEGPITEEGFFTEEAGLSVEMERPVNEPGAELQSDMTSGITAAFKNFKEQLEEHFTVSNQVNTKLWIIDTFIDLINNFISHKDEL